MSKFNWFILFIIGLVVLLRICFYIINNCIFIYIIVTSVESTLSIFLNPYFSVIFRGIISPVNNTIELCLISYMICHQDMKNRREEAKIKKISNKNGGNEKEEI